MNNYHQTAALYANEVQLTKDDHNTTYITSLTDFIKVIDENQFDLEFAYSYILQNKSFFDEVGSDVCFLILKHKIVEMIRDKDYTQAYTFMYTNLGP